MSQRQDQKREKRKRKEMAIRYESIQAKTLISDYKPRSIRSKCQDILNSITKYWSHLNETAKSEVLLDDDI